MELLGFTATGLEDEAGEEIEELTDEAQSPAPGRVAVETDAAGMARLNYCSGTCSRFIEVVSRFEAQDPIAISDRIDFDPTRFMTADRTFAVEVTRDGDQDFNSVPAAREAGQKVIDLFEDETGETLSVDLDDPDITFRLDLHGEDAWFGPDTTGTSLNQRHYLDDHTGVTPPVLANLVVRASPWDPGERLVDPMTVGGVIPIEAGRIACRIPNSERRFDFLKFSGFDPTTYADVARAARDTMDIRELMLEGSSEEPGRSEMNARSSGLDIPFSQRSIEDRPLDGCHVVIDAISSGSPASQSTDRSGNRLVRRLQEVDQKLEDAVSATVVTDQDDLRPDEGKEISWAGGELRMLRW